MFLSQDKNGNIYQAASHRSDGKGVERVAVLSGGGDVALDNPYQKAEAERQRNNTLLDLYNAQEKLDAEVRKRQMGAHALKVAKKVALKEAYLSDPYVQKKLLEEAIMQGMHGPDFDMLDTVNGYGKTSDGRRGKSVQEKAREAAILQGLGEEPAMTDQGLVYDLTPEEKEQYDLSLQAETAKKQAQESKAYVESQTLVKKGNDSVAAQLPPLEANPGDISIKAKTIIANAGAPDTGALESNLKWIALGAIAVMLLRK